MKRFSTLIALAIFCTLTSPAMGQTVLKMATLAPENSAWDKVFKRSEKEGKIGNEKGDTFAKITYKHNK